MLGGKAQAPTNPARTEGVFWIEDIFSSVLSQFKKYHPSGNLKSIIWAFPKA